MGRIGKCLDSNCLNRQKVDFECLSKSFAQTIYSIEQGGKKVLTAFHAIAGRISKNVTNAATEILRKNIEAEEIGKRIIINPEKELENISRNLDKYVSYLPVEWSINNLNPYEINKTFLKTGFRNIFYAAVSIIRIVNLANGQGEQADYAQRFLDAFIQQSFYLSFSSVFAQRFGYKINKWLIEKILISQYRINTVENKLNGIPTGLRDVISDIIKADESRLTALAVKELSERNYFYNKGLADKLVDLYNVNMHNHFKLQLADYHTKLSPNQLLLGHMLWVLAFPLSPHQGDNGYCQSARAVSFLSQHNSPRLVKMVEEIISKGYLILRNGEREYRSSENLDPPASSIYAMDAVTFIISPYFYDIYSKALRQAVKEDPKKDPHGIVNPSTLGAPLPSGFSHKSRNASLEEFVKFVILFYSTHHPEYANGAALPFPLPVGIYVKNSGNHALSIQRVNEHKGKVRVYFYNPVLADDRKWGEVEFSNWGNGEKPGESSLPFDKFAALINAFHYDPDRIPIK